MNDLDRLSYMKDLNWKPAQTYWKEQYDKVLALYLEEAARNDELQEQLDLLTKKP
jgi:hypothetical protein